MTIQMEEPRTRLRQLVDERGESLQWLSQRLLGRNAAYLQQFLNRGTPAKLDEDDRLKLAKFFQVDERELGARDPWSPCNAEA